MNPRLLASVVGMGHGVSPAYWLLVLFLGVPPPFLAGGPGQWRVWLPCLGGVCVAQAHSGSSVSVLPGEMEQQVVAGAGEMSQPGECVRAVVCVHVCGLQWGECLGCGCATLGTMWEGTPGYCQPRPTRGLAYLTHTLPRPAPPQAKPCAPVPHTHMGKGSAVRSRGGGAPGSLLPRGLGGGCSRCQVPLRSCSPKPRRSS